MASFRTLSMLCDGTVVIALEIRDRRGGYAQQRLYFLPEPQGQSSLRPTRGVVRR